MLKIKDNVDLKELEKFGFEYEEWNSFYSRDLERKKEEVKLIVYPDSRKIEVENIQDYRIDGEEYYTKATIEQVKDLQESGYVEKVEEE